MECIMVELPPIVSVAFEVIGGKYGNGDERIRKLKSEGYDANLVQNCVNDILNIMKRYGG